MAGAGPEPCPEERRIYDDGRGSVDPIAIGGWMRSSSKVERSISTIVRAWESREWVERESDLRADARSTPALAGRCIAPSSIPEID